MTHDHDHPAEPALADMLDLDGQVLSAYWTAAFDWVGEHAPHPVERVLDLGAGSGVGTLALAVRFPAAQITAVDLDEQMLDRIRHRAEERGLAGRVHTVVADLDEQWPDVEPVDLAWASNSLHHLVNPDHALAGLFGALRPGASVAVAEFNEALRFLPDDLGDGLEARCLELSRHDHAVALPHLGSDWSSWLTGAGFELVGERTFEIDVTEPSPEALGYAHFWLSRLRSGGAERLVAGDARLLGDLLDEPDPGLARVRLHIRGERTVTMARKPGTRS